MFFITAIQASAVIELCKRENAKSIPNFYLKTYRNIVAQNKKLMKKYHRRCTKKPLSQNKKESELNNGTRQNSFAAMERSFYVCIT